MATTTKEHWHNFNCVIETEGLFKVTDGHELHGKSGNISETVQPIYRGAVNTEQEVIHGLSNGNSGDLECPSGSCTKCINLLKCDFSHSHAAISDKISTVIARLRSGS